eukprot:TRINITY_DN1168_c0_g1_i9.p1 TRINITY_DN1168_c0_g1~~TRINITY_DN1168_c0_g1_i9.p1  ORF type:complete len:116 (+),score=15.50 TRINITY_DN1168_c0_g1_i9:354-701(+)
MQLQVLGLAIQLVEPLLQRILLLTRQPTPDLVHRRLDIFDLPHLSSMSAAAQIRVCGLRNKTVLLQHQLIQLPALSRVHPCVAHLCCDAWLAVLCHLTALGAVSQWDASLPRTLR